MSYEEYRKAVDADLARLYGYTVDDLGVSGLTIAGLWLSSHDPRPAALELCSQLGLAPRIACA
jgi:hypothetical protein